MNSMPRRAAWECSPGRQSIQRVRERAIKHAGYPTFGGPGDPSGGLRFRREALQCSDCWPGSRFGSPADGRFSWLLVRLGSFILVSLTRVARLLREFGERFAHLDVMYRRVDDRWRPLVACRVAKRNMARNGHVHVRSTCPPAARKVRDRHRCLVGGPVLFL
jgi:hypothetical protein